MLGWMAVRMAILGDFDAGMHTHAPMLAALRQAAGTRHLDAAWVRTDQFDVESLGSYDGLLLAPGSPYADFANVLRAIQRARRGRVPFLGICGGFQHVLIEFARHRMGLDDADSMEHGRASRHNVIVPMACRLQGRHIVQVLPETRLASICGGAGEFEETHFCGFQADASYEARFVEYGLVVNARAPDGVPRGCELTHHPFFVATAFQPQMRAGHPLMAAFVAVAAQRALLRVRGGGPRPKETSRQNTGPAAANAQLSAGLLTGFAGGRLLVAGADPEHLSQGLDLSRFEVTFTDMNPALLAHLPFFEGVLDDMTGLRPEGPFAAALVMLALEQQEWRRQLASLARLSDELLVVIQRNPAAMATAVTPGATRAFGFDARPHSLAERELAAEARRSGYGVISRHEVPVAEGKAAEGDAIVGWHFSRLQDSRVARSLFG